MQKFQDARVMAVFEACPPGVRGRLMALRELVFDTAARTAGVGRLSETLKWGQASYLTAESGSGTTVRALGHCIALALAHRLRKRTGSRKT